MVASIQVARKTPISIGNINSGRPMTTGIPMGRIRQLAAEKVAPDIEVWIRFWRCTLRYF